MARLYTLMPGGQSLPGIEVGTHRLTNGIEIASIRIGHGRSSVVVPVYRGQLGRLLYATVGKTRRGRLRLEACEDSDEPSIILLCTGRVIGGEILVQGRRRDGSREQLVMASVGTTLRVGTSKILTFEVQ